MLSSKKVVGLVVGVGAVVTSAVQCFAIDGPVVTAIQGQVTTLTADAVTVIGSAVALGAVFFGAKLLWGKFKGMAK